jgi:hypothetical protein
MNKIIIAYHTYMYGSDYGTLIDEQLKKMLYAGLFDACDKLYIGVIESPARHPLNGVQWLTEYCKHSPKVEIMVYSDNKEEANTLKWVRDYSLNNPGDYVLYFHTKGIARRDTGTESWRRYMEYFTIENWTDCVQKLKEGYSCCGVEWMWNTPIGIYPHFSGNFWWASTDYLSSLNHAFLDAPNRLFREFWIGSNPGVRQFSFHHMGGNPYTRIYPRSNYEKR